MIEAKLKGVKPEPQPEPEARGNVIDLMAALRRSLGEDAPKPSGKTKPRAPATKPSAAKPKKAKAAAKPSRRRSA